jgi:hypothetical protein
LVPSSNLGKNDRRLESLMTAEVACDSAAPMAKMESKMPATEQVTNFIESLLLQLIDFHNV